MPVELVVEGVQCGSALVRADVGGGIHHQSVIYPIETE